MWASSSTLVYYNEWDKFKADWLRLLGGANEIPEGFVDERSVLDLQPSDLAGYRQLHFFAGIGGWALALRIAGLEKAFEGWTASLPCQPFSSAGKRRAFSDERHFWPSFFKLIDKCRPGKILGEQVDSKDGRAWLSRVQADLESIGYTVGRSSLNSAGVGSPNIRQRLYWVAYRSVCGRSGDDGGGQGSSLRTDVRLVRMADSDGPRREGVEKQNLGTKQPEQQTPRRRNAQRRLSDGPLQQPEIGRDRTQESAEGSVSRVKSYGLGNPDSKRRSRNGRSESGGGASLTEQSRSIWLADSNSGGSREGRRDDGQELRIPQEKRASKYGPPLPRRSCPPGFWEDCFAIPLGDGTARRVGRGVFPVAPRLSSRVGSPKSEIRRMAKDARTNRAGRIMGYGDAINPWVAAEFILAAEEAVKEMSLSKRPRRGRASKKSPSSGGGADAR